MDLSVEDEFSQRGRLASTGTQTNSFSRRTDMTTWETPTFDDVRFGFEVTMYINNR